VPKNQPKATLLKDYQPFAFVIESVTLLCALHDDQALITSTLVVRQKTAGVPLRLDGRELELIAISLDDQPLAADRYQLDNEALTLLDPPAAFSLRIATRIHPQANTSLEGLYSSNGIFCTQCEAEGFRKITFFPDRPDVLSRFTVTLEAEAKAFPVLLANGNLLTTAVLADGRHSATWQDPFPKPCYLFAMVAGDLACLREGFVTKSGRQVSLAIYSEHHNAAKCGHAMRSLKQAMAWDEKRFGLEYDLDQYMIVAVDDFNAGAMENKGLNIFNSKYVLAQPQTATDVDYNGIESVVAHEYFHNWTGNRVTCRDWFQLSLKEGLTVFRDQEFSADTNSRAEHRIHDVIALRASQFPEDAGPMAHPVRPESYIEINNFYTMTVYEKGAEVIRMLHTILGEERFQRGMAIYLQRHDGGAATTDDFVRAMEEALGEEGGLAQFRLWYSQPGTPQLVVSSHFDQAAKEFCLNVRQVASPRAGETPAMLHIPLAIGLLGPDGGQLPLRLKGEDRAGGTSEVLHLRGAEQSFTFTGIEQRPVPSLLRGFSAPVRLQDEASDDDLCLLAEHDPDPFARWEAGQRLMVKTILSLMEEARAERPLSLSPTVEKFVRGALDPRRQGDEALLAQLLTLPAEDYLAEQVTEIDVDAIHAAREFLRGQLRACLGQEWLATYQANQTPPPYRYQPKLAGKRRLKNLCLGYLMAGPAPVTDLALNQFQQADNMTDSLAALTVLVHADGAEAEAKATLMAFANQWQGEALVMDKWFAVQASAPRPGTLSRVKALLGHPAFSITNPNKVRALLGAFAANPICFHDKGGAGYQFLADQVLGLDPINPHIAARLAGRFAQWRRHLPARQALMRSQLERMLACPTLSKGVFEVVSRTLA